VNIVQHNKEECPEVVIDCHYELMGCQYRGKRGNMDEHHKDSSHIELMLKEVTGLQQQINMNHIQETALKSQVSNMNNQMKNLTNQVNNLTNQVNYLMNIVAPNGFDTSRKEITMFVNTLNQTDRMDSEYCQTGRSEPDGNGFNHQIEINSSFQSQYYPGNFSFNQDTNLLNYPRSPVSDKPDEEDREAVLRMR